MGCVVAYTGRRYRPIKLVGLAPARLDDLIKFLAKRVLRYRAAQP
jgi:cobalamin biosynthesis protein CobD/CbiB